MSTLKVAEGGGQQGRATQQRCQVDIPQVSVSSPVLYYTQAIVSVNMMAAHSRNAQIRRARVDRRRHWEQRLGDSTARYHSRVFDCSTGGTDRRVVHSKDVGQWSRLRARLRARSGDGRRDLRLCGGVWHHVYFRGVGEASSLSCAWSAARSSCIWEFGRSWRPPPILRRMSRPRGLGGAYLSTFFLTITNPMTILSFAAIFAGVGVSAGTGLCVRDPPGAGGFCRLCFVVVRAERGA